jgi:hypothetical protein
MISTSPQLPSERSFGRLFSVVFALAGGYALYKGAPRTVAVALFLLALVVLVLTLAAPKTLAPFNRAWFKLGLLLGKIVSPIVLGAMFFLIVTPVGFVARWMGRDALRLRKRETASHWVERNPAGPDPESFKNQF